MANESRTQNFIPLVDGGKFRCSWSETKGPNIFSVIRWFVGTKNNSNVPDDEEELDKVLPVLSIDYEKVANPPKDGIQVMWIGHATVLVQFDGITILTDPEFKDKCRRYFGLGRFRKSSCKIEDLPKVDAVLISHSHGDHYDESSVDSLNRRFPRLHWYVPIGLGHKLTDMGCENVHEMTWWDEEKQVVTPDDEKNETSISDDGNTITFICTPGQHWSGRKRLWCSWVVKGLTKTFYFAGDTGYYQPLFKEIGRMYGPFDLAALPIGAYDPRFLTEFQHVDPEEAVKIHCDIRSKMSVAMHWGTLVLTNEFYLEPPHRVKKEMEKVGQAASNFQCLNLGEIWAVGEHRETPPFMKIDIEALEEE